MPYIKVEDRIELEADLRNLFSSMSKVPDLNAGTLNYLFTRIAHEYLKVKGKRYQYLNDVSGALQNADKELYRRVAAEYEDECIKRNGDVLEI